MLVWRAHVYVQPPQPAKKPFNRDRHTTQNRNPIKVFSFVVLGSKSDLQSTRSSLLGLNIRASNTIP